MSLTEKIVVAKISAKVMHSISHTIYLLNEWLCSSTFFRKPHVFCYLCAKVMLHCTVHVLELITELVIILYQSNVAGMRCNFETAAIFESHFLWFSVQPTFFFTCAATITISTYTFPFLASASVLAKNI